VQDGELDFPLGWRGLTAGPAACPGTEWWAAPATRFDLDRVSLGGPRARWRGLGAV